MGGLRLEDFAGSVGERFELRAGDETLPFELQAAQASPGHSLREVGSSFHLFWLGPAEPILTQAVYEIRRGDEAYEMFIVPIRSDEKGTLYEAVFN
jgi:hypothetical protein